MDFLELAETRFSVRSFSGKPIASETVQAILRAGHCEEATRREKYVHE